MNMTSRIARVELTFQQQQCRGIAKVAWSQAQSIYGEHTANELRNWQQEGGGREKPFALLNLDEIQALLNHRAMPTHSMAYWADRLAQLKQWHADRTKFGMRPQRYSERLSA